jgi:ATP-dependent DNA ligase
VKAAYLDDELCGVDDAGLPSFAQAQAATDGESDARLVYYTFDLLHLTVMMSRGCRSSCARRFLSPWSGTSPAFSSMAMKRATANLS